MESEVLSNSGSVLTQIGESYTFALLVIYILYSFGKDIIKHKENQTIKHDKAVIFETIRKSHETQEKIREYLEISIKKYNEKITKQQAIIIIDKTHNLMSLRIILYGMEIMNKNNVLQNKEEIRSKLERYISNLYIEEVNLLNEFEIEDMRMSKLINTTDAKRVSNKIYEIILKGKSHEVLISYCENTFRKYVEEKKSLINKV